MKPRRAPAKPPFPVRCHGTLTPIESLKPHPDNPNTHPERQLRLYRKILQTNGWRRPIVVSRRSGFIVRGHGAWLAARALGWSMVPVERQAYATEAEELRDLLADNQLARLSEPDDEALEELLAELAADGRDPELAGIENTLRELQGPPQPKPVTLRVIVSCESEEQRAGLMVELTAQGETVKLKR